MSNLSSRNPRITTVIPTYRRPRLLARAIESVLTQSYGDFLVRICDNASEDETADVVAEYAKHDDRITYVCNPVNIGPVKNMQQGVESVGTEFYSLLNDDDFLLPSFFENAIRAFNNSPQAGFTCAKIIIANSDKNKIHFRNKDWQSGIYEPSHEVIEKMFHSHFVTTGVLFRREMREQVGSFEAGGSDLILMTMAAAMCPFVVVDVYGAVLTYHSQTYSSKGGIGKQETLSSIYGMLVETSQAILMLEVPADRKVHLLALVMNSYFRTLEYKKVKICYLGGLGTQDNAEILPLPSRLSAFDLTDRLFARTPKIAYPALRAVINSILRIRDIKRSIMPAEEWVALPEKAHSVLRSDTSGIADFLSALNDVNLMKH